MVNQSEKDLIKMWDQLKNALIRESLARNEIRNLKMEILDHIWTYDFSIPGCTTFDFKAINNFVDTLNRKPSELGRALEVIPKKLKDYDAQLPDAGRKIEPEDDGSMPIGSAVNAD